MHVRLQQTTSTLKSYKQYVPSSKPDLNLFAQNMAASSVAIHWVGPFRCGILRVKIKECFLFCRNPSKLPENETDPKPCDVMNNITWLMVYFHISKIRKLKIKK